MTVKFQLSTAVSMAAIAGVYAFSMTGAYAADLYQPAPRIVAVPAPSPLAHWTGFYAGFGIGGAFGSNDLDRIHTKDAVKVEGTADFSPSSFFGTVEGGYDYQVDRMVFGAAANFDFNLSHSTESYSKDEKETISESLSNAWGVGLRAGWLASDYMLLYGTAGYTGRQMEASAAKTDAPDYAFSKKHTLSGYYLGAGIETLFTDRVSLKTEYRFSRYGDFNTAAFDADGHYASFGDLDVHQIRATLNWRF
jgi:outer membrane immunogenic protein